MARGRLGGSGRRYISSQRTCGRILEKKKGETRWAQHCIYLYARASLRYTYIIYIFIKTSAVLVREAYGFAYLGGEGGGGNSLGIYYIIHILLLLFIGHGAARSRLPKIQICLKNLRRRCLAGQKKKRKKEKEPEFCNSRNGGEESFGSATCVPRVCLAFLYIII